MQDTNRPDAPTHRLFFALWPPAPVRNALAAAAQGVRAFDGAGRPVPAAKYHLTLHFLGGWPTMPEDVIERVRAAVQSVRGRAFHLVVDRAGGFREARVGWLAPAGNSGLDALWSELRRALDEAGVVRRADARFTPHVTVLRGMRAEPACVDVPPVSWPVDGFVLVHSHDGRYEVIERWPLDAR